MCSLVENLLCALRNVIYENGVHMHMILKSDRELRTIDYRRRLCGDLGPSVQVGVHEGSLTSAVQFCFATHSPKEYVEQTDLIHSAVCGYI